MSNKPDNPYQGVIAVTGVMGSGKTTLSRMLQVFGARVIFADELAREVLDPAYEGYERLARQIAQNFSSSQNTLFDSSGRLIRAELGRRAFATAENTNLLNSIVHPEVRCLFEKKRAQNEPGKIIVYDVPLLFETHMESFFEMVIVVYAPQELCLKRAVERLKISEDEAKNRMARQISIEKKRQLADYVVNNQGTLQELEEKVKELWQYLQNRTTPEEGER